MHKYNKAKLPNNVYKNNNYKRANYSGITKILYGINHRLMDFGVNSKFNKHILDVGGGAAPHLDFMKLENIISYTVLDSSQFKKSIMKLNNLKKIKDNNIKIRFLDYKKKSSYKKGNYTRMLSSHTFEHFDNFENNFLKLLPLLKKNAIISTALPCDPGLTWRFLQFFSYLKQKNIYKWKNLKQKDLDDARDHITPVQNIFKIINYYFCKIKTIYFPFIIPVISINIFLIIQVKLSDVKR